MFTKKKILLSFLAVFLTPSLAFGAVAKNQLFEIVDFSGLLKSQIQPYLIPKDSALTAQNLRANELYGALSKRNDMLEYCDTGSSAVRSLFRYYKSDGTKKLIASSGTNLYVGNDDTATCSVIGNSLSSGRRWMFVTYKDIVIGFNGSDPPKKYDGKTDTTSDASGARTSELLVADLGAPFAELSSGSNLDATSWYQYRVVSYNGTTYRYSTARSNPILTGSTNKAIKLTDIPLGPSGTTNRYVYRTVGNASQAAVEADTSFYLLATISDNTSREYTDNISDATILSDNAPTWATVSAGTDVTPPLCKLVTIHQDHIFCGRTPTDKSTVYWSDVLNPDQFDTVNDNREIRPDDGDELTFLIPQIGILVGGKSNSVQKIYTEDSDTSNWSVSSIFSTIGTPASYAAVPTPLGIVYPSYKGIYAFDGQNSRLISDSVTKEIDDISKSSLNDTAGIYANNTYQLSYQSDSTGAGNNNRVLILDIVRNSYVIDIKSIDSFAYLGSGSDLGTIFSGSSEADGKIYANQETVSELIFRTVSDLEDGTVDTVNIYGSEQSPQMNLGWGATIDSTAYTGVTLDSVTYSTAIINRVSTSGVWLSPAVSLDSKAFDKIFWNESLGTSGDVTFAIRVASTEAGISSASFSSEFTDPQGDDVSGVTANKFVQLRASLSTSDITESPELFTEDNQIIRLLYSKFGSSAETSVASIWESGWLRIAQTLNETHLKRIEIHYTGEGGTLTFNYKNSDGSIDDSFDIDLSVDPDDDQNDNYYGNSMEKIYRYGVPALNSDEDQAIGQYWKFKIIENGNVEWKIYRIGVHYDIVEYN